MRDTKMLCLSIKLQLKRVPFQFAKSWGQELDIVEKKGYFSLLCASD